jgi:hypothetical protein
VSFRVRPDSYDNRGGAIVHFDGRSKKKCASALTKERLHMLDRNIYVYTVMPQDGVLIAVGHRSKRLPRT